MGVEPAMNRQSGGPGGRSGDEAERRRADSAGVERRWRGRRGGREKMDAREQSERVLGEDHSIEIDIFLIFFFLPKKVTKSTT